MKKITVLTMLFLSVVIYKPVDAQININLSAQPSWGPVGYDRVDYYYLPDVDAYYSVPKRQFIYEDGNKWVFANALPARYSGYDLYKGHKVVINDPNPYLHPEIYREKYGKYKNGRGPSQVIIRDSHDERYKNNGPRIGGHEDNGNHKNRGIGNGNRNDRNMWPGKVIIGDRRNDDRFDKNRRRDNDDRFKKNGRDDDDDDKRFKKNGHKEDDDDERGKGNDKNRGRGNGKGHGKEKD